MNITIQPCSDLEETISLIKKTKQLHESLRKSYKGLPVITLWNKGLNL